MNRHLLFKILTLWFLLTQTFPPYFYFVPMSRALCLAIFVGAGFMMFPNLLTKRTIIASIIYGLITFIYFINGNAFFDTINSVVVPFLHMIAALLLLEYTLHYDTDYKFSKLVVYEVIVLNLLMALISIPQLIINPNIIRGASVSSIEDADEQVYYWITEYATMHGLPLLMAPLVFLCQKIYRINKKSFLFWLVATFALYAIVFMSNATTAFLLSTLLIGIALIFRWEQFTKQNIGILIIVGLFSLVLTTPQVQIAMLDTAQSFMNEQSSNYFKMEEMKESIIYDDANGDLGARQTLYETSNELFWESPLTGTETPDKVSRHTYIMDRLAVFGIFMIIPLVLVFVYNFKRAYNSLKHTKVTYTFGFIGLLLMLAFKNEFGSGTWLYGFALLPIFCRYIDSIIDNNNVNTTSISD